MPVTAARFVSPGSARWKAESFALTCPVDRQVLDANYPEDAAIESIAPRVSTPSLVFIILKSPEYVSGYPVARIVYAPNSLGFQIKPHTDCAPCPIAGASSASKQKRGPCGLFDGIPLWVKPTKEGGSLGNGAFYQSLFCATDRVPSSNFAE